MLVFVCVCMICMVLFSTAEVAQAGFLEMFKETILDFFGIETGESQSLGIESRKETAVGKHDLLIELQEKMIDNSERLVSSHDPEDDTITGSSSYYFENTNDRILLTGTYQFPTPVPIEQVSGVYLEDYYLSFKE